MNIRDGDERDLEKILSLRQLVFGDFEEDKLRPDFWRWEFMDGPGGKAFIYIAEDEGRLAGHFADIPRWFSVKGEVLPGTLSLDLMVHPDYRRKGIFLEMGRYAARRVKSEKALFMTAFPVRKETIAGLLKIGWERVGDLPVLVFPLRFSGIVNRFLHCSPLSLLIGGMVRLSYNLMLGKGLKRRLGRIEVEEIGQLDDEVDRFWEKASVLYPILGVRDRAFLTWRYLKHPTRAYKLLRAIEKAEMTGYLVLRKVDLLNFKSMVIVDMLALNEKALISLVEEGIDHSRKAGTDLLGCMIPRKHPYYLQLRSLRFLPSPKAFHFMVYRFSREQIPQDPEAWYVNWGDTDVI